MARMVRCRTCDAPIVFARHERTGKPAPVELDVRPGGNIELADDETTYRIVTPDPAQLAHYNHYANCPQAAFWHKEARS